METKNHLYDIEVERNVIGSILSYRKVLDEVRDLLCVDTFFENIHRNIYTAALNLSGKGDPVDILTVIDELKRMGVADDMTMYNVTTLSGCTVGDYYYNARILYELYSRRKIWDAAQILANKAADMTFDLSETINVHNEALSNVFSTSTASISTVRDAIQELYENYIMRNLSGTSEITGSPTGFKEFDEKSGGLHAGNLIVVAAETSQGKTSFAMSAAFNAARHNHRIAVYSLEMSTAELMARVAAGETGLPVNRILYNQLYPEELKLFETKMLELADLPVYFDDKSTSNIDVIISSIRTMVAKYGIKGAVIDYLQILNVNMKGSNTEQQMAEVARQLKNLAKDLGIWIIALSQLSRDQHTHVPTLNRLRNSGQIAEAADTVVLLYRPEVFEARYPEPFKDYATVGTAMVDIAKGRNIGHAKFLVGFKAETTKFYELTSIPQLTLKDENPF